MCVFFVFIHFAPIKNISRLVLRSYILFSHYLHAQTDVSYNRRIFVSLTLSMIKWACVCFVASSCLNWIYLIKSNISLCNKTVITYVTLRRRNTKKKNIRKSGKQNCWIDLTFGAYVNGRIKIGITNSNNVGKNCMKKSYTHLDKHKHTHT